MLEAIKVLTNEETKEGELELGQQAVDTGQLVDEGLQLESGVQIVLGYLRSIGTIYNSQFSKIINRKRERKVKKNSVEFNS